MCQIYDLPMERQRIKAYRVYRKRGDREKSIYRHHSRGPLNKKLRADSDEPFHAFRTREDVRTWFVYYWRCSKIVVVRECILEDDVSSGLWSSGTEVKTVTGTSATIGKIVVTLNRKQSLVWR